ncbi:MAG TPA: SRPBCC family protein [Nitrospira sp.]|nr:SRPBCC family protein [Nitrospira sp.]
MSANRLSERWSILGSAGLGALCMYLLDPRSGKRRRALLRDRLVRFAHASEDGMATTWRDARNRWRGLWAETFRSERAPVSDEILVERVRSQLGSLVRHPRSIDVRAENGRVVLSGSILSEDMARLLGGVARVKGVTEIVNELSAHERPADTPRLQGEPARVPTGHRFELMQKNWSPSARATVAMADTASAVYGLSRRDAAGAALGLAGLAVVARAWLNRPWTRMTGVAAGHRAVDVNKTIVIRAPLERVFRFWSNYREFPRYTSHVQEVIERGEGRSRWTVTGPAGMSLSWNAVITKMLPNRELAWRTEPGSPLQHAGALKFRDNGDGTTTVHARISYNPPGGAIGHGTAALMGSDLKTLLEEDLVRIKTVLEEGKIPRDAQQSSGTSSMPALKSEQLEQ